MTGEVAATLVMVTGIALTEPTVWVIEGIEVDTGRPVMFSCVPRDAWDWAEATPGSGLYAEVDPRQMMWRR